MTLSYPCNTTYEFIAVQARRGSRYKNSPFLQARCSILGLVASILGLLGDACFMKILRGQAQTLDKSLAMHDFIDRFLISSNIPMLLIR